MPSPFELVTPPTDDQIFELLDKKAVKQNLRIQHSREDGLIEQFILDAHAYLDGVSGYVRRPILPAVYDVQASRLDHRIPLTLPSVLQVTAISHYDSAGAWTTLDPQHFTIVPVAHNPTLQFIGPSLPASGRLDGYGLRMTVLAGEREGSPARRCLRRAMLLLASDFYRNREATYGDARQSLNNRSITFGVETLLQRFKRPLMPGEA